jgi:hypothetical protein
MDMNDLTELDDGEELGLEVSDESLEAASSAHPKAASSLGSGSFTISFICCSVA